MRYVALKLHQVLVRSGAAVRVQLGKRQVCALCHAQRKASDLVRDALKPRLYIFFNRVVEVGLHADLFARFILYDSCFRRFQRKMGLKRPIGILQNQTSGLLQLILYKRRGKVVGDTLFFERLTQGVTEEVHALGYDLSVRYFYGSQPTDEQIHAIQSEPCEGVILLATEMHTAAYDYAGAKAAPRSPGGRPFAHSPAKKCARDLARSARARGARA